MDKIYSPIKGRVMYYIENKGLTKESFFKKTGISASNFKGNNSKSELGGDNIVKILTNYPEISAEWLLTGKGNMLKEETKQISVEISGNHSGHNSIGEKMNKIFMKEYKTEVNQRVIDTINFILNNKIVEKKGELSKKLDVGQSKFSEIMNKRMSAGMDIIQNLCNNFEVNAEWLITGEGEMFKNSSQPTPASSDIATHVSPTYPHAIPFYEGFAVGGYGGFTQALSTQDIKDYYVIPKFKDKHIDFMIEVTGTSMSPLYNNGDVVACTIINESIFIQWNKVHVIATREQGLLIKRIRKSNNTDCFLLVSDNEEYAPFDIPKTEIYGIALVAGVIRLE